MKYLFVLIFAASMMFSLSLFACPCSEKAKEETKKEATCEGCKGKEGCECQKGKECKCDKCNCKEKSGECKGDCKKECEGHKK